MKKILFPFKALFALVAAVIDYILAVHSSSALASWSRWIGTSVVASIIYFVAYATHKNILIGNDLAIVLSALVGSISAIIAAGKVADGLSGVEKSIQSFSIVDTLKKFLKKQ